MPRTLILASASAARRRLLDNAGAPFRVVVSEVDETAIKAACRDEGLSAEAAAHRLALAKAEAVSRRHPETPVLGADQLLTCGGEWYDKPADLSDVRSHLMALRGRVHRLVNAAVIVESGRLVWRHDDAAAMHMRDLSDAFIETYIETYIETVGGAAYRSVGAYRLEGLGAQLFERADGDFFSILGLPLLAVLAALRERGILRS